MAYSLLSIGIDDFEDHQEYAAFLTPSSTTFEHNSTTRRVDLYARVLRGLVRRAWKPNRLKVNDPHIDDMLRLLEQVARRLFEAGPRSNLFTKTAVTEAIDATPKRPLPWILRQRLKNGSLDTRLLAYATSFLCDECLETGILVDAGLNRDNEVQWSFLHRTFQEYLTASALAREAKARDWSSIEAFVDKKAWLPEWQEVVVFLAGRLADPMPLVTLLSDETRDDVFRHRLAVLILTLPEVATDVRRARSARVDKTVDAAFSLWWGLLVRDLSAAAPHLQRMLSTLAVVSTERPGIGPLPWLCQRLKQDDEEKRFPPSRQHWRPADAAHASQGLTGVLPNAREDDRVCIARTLGIMGAAVAWHPDVIPALLNALPSKDSNIRRAAIEALGDLGKAAGQRTEVIPALMTILKDFGSDSDLRGAAAEALSKLGEAAAEHPEVIPALLAICLRDGNTLCLGAAKALRELCEAAPQHPEVARNVIASFTTALLSKDKDMRGAAADAFQAMGHWAAQYPEVLPTLTQTLRDQDVWVRRGAAWALGAIGEAAAQHREVISTLITTLNDADEYVREAVVQALGELGAAAAEHPEVVPALIATRLHDKNLFIRSDACYAVCKIGEIGPSVIPILLITALRNQNPGVRAAAAGAFGEFVDATARHHEVIPALLNSLRDKSSIVRANAARSLGELGEVAGRDPRVIPALLHAAHDGDERVRQNAAGALAITGELSKGTAREPEVMLTLLKVLSDKHEEVREAGAWALGELGQATAERSKAVITAALLKAVRDEKEEDVRRAVAWALVKLGKPGARYPEAIRALLRAGFHFYERNYSRDCTAEAFAKAVTHSPEVIPVLAALLHDQNKVARGSAAEAIEAMGEAAARHPEIISQLFTAGLRDDWVYYRTAAALARFHGAGIRVFRISPDSWHVRTVVELSQ